MPDQQNQFKHVIRTIPLDRMIWDPANKSQEISDHYEWADSVAMPAEDVERAYGYTIPDKEKLPTLGSLRAFEGATSEIRGVQGLSKEESRTPAVLLTEYYTDWFKTLTIFVHSGTTENDCKAVWQGPNPYGFCPYMHLTLGMSLLSLWGVGVPIQLRQHHTLFNIAMTSIARHLVTTSAVRWLYEEDTVRSPSSVFSPRVGGPIAVTRNRTEPPILPQMIQPPNMNDIAWNLVSILPAMFDQTAHVSSILRGVAPPRDSGSAIREKLSQAGRFFVSVGEDDQERQKKFMTKVVMFLAESAPPEALLDAVGPDLQAKLMERLQQPPVLKTRIELMVRPDAIQPRTPDEMKQDIKELASLKALSPDEMKWEWYRATGKPVTSEQHEAVVNAINENQKIMSGEQVFALDFEPHALHIFCHKQVIRCRHTWNVPDEVVLAVQIHIADHYDDWGDERGIEGAMIAEAQGQTGAGGMAAGNALADSPLGGAMSAPEATESQYAARDAAMQAAPPPIQ
ncbi:hypothetical protein IMZ48_23335 [Candidatus Bathyarchaeota archaeon]|nr:hypothetical protein [Candidatus Bathyarchaeota archaeon]